MITRANQITLVLGMLGWLTSLPPSHAAVVRLTVESGPRGVVSASGLDREQLRAVAASPERAGALLKVVTRNASELPIEVQPAVIGRYEIDAEKGQLTFQPRFPWEPGVRYMAVVRQPDGASLRKEFGLPAIDPGPPTTSVTRVSPGRDVLPENLLRFYIEFSAPMGRGEAYEHVHLLDERGRALDLPFLELGEELWDPRGTRFTLLFDPGRIKTGVKPREDLGPVLIAGKSYTLVVDAGWHDAAGRPLTSEFRKTFRVTSPDMTSPDPKAWSLNHPADMTRAPLVVRFPEPLDRAMLGRVVVVADAAGKAVPGVVAIGEQENSWSFVPELPWRAGTYQLLVDRALEDNAGNSVARPFEVDVFERIERRSTPETIAIPFVIDGR